MSKNKNGGTAAPAKEKKAAGNDEDWRELCRDCEILRKGNDCAFGCELVKAFLKKKKGK